MLAYQPMGLYPQYATPDMQSFVHQPSSASFAMPSNVEVAMAHYGVMHAGNSRNTPAHTCMPAQMGPPVGAAFITPVRLFNQNPAPTQMIHSKNVMIERSETRRRSSGDPNIPAIPAQKHATFDQMDAQEQQRNNLSTGFMIARKYSDKSTMTTPSSPECNSLETPRNSGTSASAGALKHSPMFSLGMPAMSPKIIHLNAASPPPALTPCQAAAPHIPKLKLPVWEEFGSPVRTKPYYNLSQQVHVPAGPSSASSPQYGARSPGSHRTLSKTPGQTPRPRSSEDFTTARSLGLQSAASNSEAHLDAPITWTLSHANLASHVQGHPEKKGGNTERDNDLHSIYTASILEFEAASRREPKWAGLGITFKSDRSTGEMRIHEIVPGGGAARCGGVKKGDILVEIDGQEILGMEPEHMSRLFVGNIGSKVYVGVRRPPSETLLRYCIVRCKQSPTNASLHTSRTESARSLASQRADVQAYSMDAYRTHMESIESIDRLLTATVPVS